MLQRVLSTSSRRFRVLSSCGAIPLGRMLNPSICIFRRPYARVHPPTPRLPPVVASVPKAKTWKEEFKNNGILYGQLFLGLILVCVAGVYYIYWVTHQEKVDFPGLSRTQFLLRSEEFMHQQGLIEIRNILKPYEGKILPPGAPLSRRVQKIGNQLIQSSGHQRLKNKKIRFIVVDDPSVPNALSSPDGTVVFFSGILNFCTDDSEIAWILGHEIGHLAAQHSREMASSVWFWFQRNFNSHHSHIMEHEADFIGMMLLARACYSPTAAIAVLQKLQKLGDPSMHGEGKTAHPDFEKRLQLIQETLPEAFKQTARCRPSIADLEHMVDRLFVRS